MSGRGNSKLLIILNIRCLVFAINLSLAGVVAGSGSSGSGWASTAVDAVEPVSTVEPVSIDGSDDVSDDVSDGGKDGGAC